MDQEQKKIVQDLIDQQADLLANEDEFWDIKPVSPRVFFEKFLHEPAYPEQQKFVDAVLGTKAEEWDMTYPEAIALVGKGGGKDRTIAKILTYCVYKLLCMKNPQKFLGLNDNELDSPGSAIDIGNVCINARLAKDVFFKNFKAMIKATKNPVTGGNWFKEQGLNLNRDIHTREIEFPKHITAYSLDSEEHTGEGLNLLLVIFDEVGGFDAAKAADLYMALVSTQKTRFGFKRKTLLLSYKRNDNDYMMIRYNQAAKEPQTYRTKASTWEWNPKRKKSDFADDYLRDPENAKRIYECSGSTAEDGYFKYKRRIRDSINPNRINPVITNEFWTTDILKLKFHEFFVPKKFQPYFVHIDLAKGKESGDSAGITLCHPVKNQDLKLSSDYLDELTKVEGFQVSQFDKKKQTGVVIDLMLQLRARPNEEIIFDEIRQFIQGLKKAGYSIKMVTFDGWQSVDSIQILNKAGIPAEELSVDRNTKAYDTLKELMYKGIFDTYDHPIFIRECEELIRTDNNKVDHPELSYKRSLEEGKIAGSKDVSDSAAGAAYTCIIKSKSTFSVGVVSDPRDHQTDGIRLRPDEEEQEKLVRYGERP